jgi:hypothetical protein
LINKRDAYFDRIFTLVDMSTLALPLDIEEEAQPQDFPMAQRLPEVAREAS